ncbi:MAG: DUF6088 family protein [Lentisphaeria bacterium]
MQDAKQQVIARIYGHGRGWAFSAKDFLDVANRGVIDKTLSNLQRNGTIRRACRGVYDYPRVSKSLNMQSPPDIDQVAHAIARKKGWRIQAAESWAANLLGLTTQVPARIVYLTDGKRSSVQLENGTIEFRPTALKNLDTGKPGLVIQALRGIGRENIDGRIITYLRKQLSDTDCRRLLDKTEATSWIYEIIKKICYMDKA